MIEPEFEITVNDILEIMLDAKEWNITSDDYPKYYVGDFLLDTYRLQKLMDDAKERNHEQNI